MKTITGVKLISLLKRLGFVPDRQRGSHVTLYNAQTGIRVTVPAHKKDLRRGTLASILRAVEGLDEHL